MHKHAPQQHRSHAIVIGGSIAGLLAARVLAEHFTHVTIVERDNIIDEPHNRKGVPQGRHVHGLLARGHEIISRLLPGIDAELIADGAIEVDMGRQMRWFQYGGYKRDFDSGLNGLLMSRPLLEYHVRRRVVALPGVRLLRGCDVRKLLTTTDRTRVTGVRIEERGGLETRLTADLVVDATGRGSRAPAWLESLGYEKPHESIATINLGYASRIYSRQDDDLPGYELAIASPTPPVERRMGAMFRIEGNRWMVLMAGWLGDHSPTDDAGFLEFAQSLPAPDIYDIISRRQPLTPVAVHKTPSNLRRRYEWLTRMPEGFVVMGDALCSFNPIYGQGMTTSALQALALGECLAAQPSSVIGLPRRFFQQAAKVVDAPWSISAGGDFVYPEVTGERPRGVDVINRYIGAVHRASTEDARVYGAFLQVMNLLASPLSLFRPGVAWRVARVSWRNRGRAPVVAARPQPAPPTPVLRTPRVRFATTARHARVDVSSIARPAVRVATTGRFARVETPR